MNSRWAKFLLWIVATAAVGMAAVWILTAREFESHKQRISEEVARFERNGLSPGSLPAGWLNALLREEDPGFYGHSGIDLRSPGSRRRLASISRSRSRS